ncbi:MAG: MBL fold metallo-hydrolase [Anaerolineales bacterium]|nr:MBL fold metallo-hydrolase [Anaerolineales bacterium]
MSSVCFLGTSNAVPYMNHENTCLSVHHAEEVILVDCPASPMPRLMQAGIDPLDVNHLILTHFHPDHVGGVPLFLMNVWLMGRTKPLNIYGIEDCIGRLEQLMDLYRWETWPDLFPVKFMRIPRKEKTPVVHVGELDVSATPVKHIIPTIGLSFKDTRTEGKLIYSSDTEPCETVISLAKDGDILIHEANGDMSGHSSAAQAGGVAEAAGVETLVLIHYPEAISESELLKQAEKTFSGVIRIARDMDRIEF